MWCALALAAAFANGCGGDDGAEEPDAAAGSPDAMEGESPDATSDRPDAMNEGGPTVFATPASVDVIAGGGPGEAARICVERIDQNLTYTFEKSCADPKETYVDIAAAGGVWTLDGGTVLYPDFGMTSVTIVSTTAGTLEGNTVTDLPLDTEITVVTEEFAEITFSITADGDTALHTVSIHAITAAP